MVTQEMLLYAMGLVGENADTEILKNMLKSVTAKVKGYTKRDSLPEGLSLLICEITADRYRAFKPGQDELPLTVSSISDGDQSVSFKAPKSAEKSISEFTKDETALLNEWRKLW